MAEGVEWEYSDVEFEAGVKRAMLSAMDGWLKMAIQRARELAPVDTGRLFREIKQDPMTPMMVDRYRVIGAFGVSGLAYARAHEFGSGVHSPQNPRTYEIRPRYAKALAFKWPNAPEAVIARQPQARETGIFFFTKVNHPGVPAANAGRGYLRPALTDTVKDGKALFTEALKAELGIERLFIQKPRKK